MPELNSVVGYPLVMLMMFSICGMLYYWFRKSGWL
jgi:magnesium transporter